MDHTGKLIEKRGGACGLLADTKEPTSKISLRLVKDTRDPLSLCRLYRVSKKEIRSGCSIQSAVVVAHLSFSLTGKDPTL